MLRHASRALAGLQCPTSSISVSERAAPLLYGETRNEMMPQQWASPCRNRCTQKYAAFTQIPWRVFCKKGCDSEGETWEECLSECNEICYKDPVLKDRQWSAYIDRSPGAATYSEECFHACVAGCGYKFEIQDEKVDQVQPTRAIPAPSSLPLPKLQPPPSEPAEPPEDIPCTSA